MTGPDTLLSQRIDELDLEPITYKLMHPEPGVTGMILVEADAATEFYRQFLMLCGWYPDWPIVPPATVDQVWHAHMLDTQKYAADCQAVFGYFLHHFPYLGTRGEDDVKAWQDAYERTCGLFTEHFGISMTGPQAAGAGVCQNDGPGGTACTNNPFCTMAVTHPGLTRPRPNRTLITA